MKIYYKLSVRDWINGDEWPLCYTSDPKSAIKEYLKQGHKLKKLVLYPLEKKNKI